MVFGGLYEGLSSGCKTLCDCVKFKTLCDCVRVVSCLQGLCKNVHNIHVQLR